MYKNVHPKVNPNTEIIVPYSFPNRKPATIAKGVAKPKRRIHIIENKKNRNPNQNRFLSLISIKN